MVAALFSGCAGLGSNLKVAPEDLASLDQETEYLINPKDVLDIQIYPDAELNREIVVSPKGTISFPLVGEVQVEGLSIANAERKLTALLEKDYLVYPQVHIRIKEFHTLTISILGEVNRPGPYKLGQEGETTLLESIAMAGGVTNIVGFSATRSPALKSLISLAHWSSNCAKCRLRTCNRNKTI